MELLIQQKELLTGLAKTYAIADRKSSMPILSNILLSSENTEKIRISSTDLYLGVSTLVHGKVNQGGSIAIPARTFFNIVKNLPDGEIKLISDENFSLKIQCGKVKYRISAMAGEDFPPLPNPGEAKYAAVKTQTLSNLISHTQFSMSNDDTRPHLSSALFEGDNDLFRMVTTDGHRLSKKEEERESGSFDFKMLITHKGIQEIKRIIDDSKLLKNNEKQEFLEVTTDGKHAFFKKDELMLSINLTEENFPPYEKVIPSQHSKECVADRNSLIDSLKRISLLANDKTGSIQLEFKPGMLSIMIENSELGEGREELDVDYNQEPLLIGFNAKYLLDVLMALSDDEICLELSGELDPCVVKTTSDDRFVSVIMPIRI